MDLAKTLEKHLQNDGVYTFMSERKTMVYGIEPTAK